MTTIPKMQASDELDSVAPVLALGVRPSLAPAGSGEDFQKAKQ